MHPGFDTEPEHQAELRELTQQVSPDSRRWRD